MDDKFMIPEGSKVSFELNGVGGNYIIKTAEAYEDIEVLSNAILFVDNGIYCTDSITPVEKLRDKEFKIIIWIQDAYTVNNGYFYSSLSDAD